MSATQVRDNAPAHGAGSPDRRTRRRPRRSAVLIALVGLIGTLVLLYPTAAAWMSQYQQSQQIDSYSSEVQQIGPASRLAALQAARDYNASLLGGQALVGAGERIPTSDGASGSTYDYSELLKADSTGQMARIKIPSIDVDLPIYHGTSDATLEKGVGHLEGTALPVGGENTHAVLTGHRGLASSTLFTHLNQVEVGDEFTIEVFGEVLTYRVTETRVVEPEDTTTLYPVAGKDLVTLVTCTPLGVNSHRILVTGERVDPTPPEAVADAGKSPDVPGFPWWALGLAAATGVLSVYVWRSGRAQR
ncbi:hypothetical protein GCM10009785_16480 [Brooklawnia cerclae]|uniref:Sortase A n=1 Tax=Brooklawnia cerclae TaxID=349934 RepID=A0ABX0SHA9_9ACTN|nr:class C sortase [Brooklawnia cerclae]NIH57783.1 sortase A [Brooklawnia cerclae]